MIKHINSTTNPALKALLKNSEDLLVCEGSTLVADILARGITVTTLIRTEDNQNPQADLPQKNVENIWIVSPRVMKKLTTLTTPPDVIAVVRAPETRVPPAPEGFILGAHNLQDPGNLGTIFRCAAAFNAAAICLTGSCVRLSNRKFLRAAQTTVFDVPAHRFSRFEDMETWCRDHDIALYVTGPRISDRTTPVESIQPPALIVFGNEGHGLDSQVILRHKSVTIPHDQKVESLNVAVSACIIMHQLFVSGS